MHGCDKGLILRAVNWREADTMLTILTETNGKISAVARGVRRKSSRISAAVQPLAYSEFTYFESSGRCTVNEAEPIELFYELRQDIVKLSLASYFAELLEVVADSERINPELLRLGLNALYALCKLSVDLRALKAAFELRIAVYSGYAPDFGGKCPRCGNYPTTPVLRLSDGAVCCADCAQSKFAVLDAGSLQAMSHILSCDIKRVFSFSLGEASLNLLSNACEEYLMEHFDRRFKTLSFYKSLA